MSEFTLHCFAESGNAYKVALMLELCGADWSGYPNVRVWLERLKSLPGWKMPEALMPTGQDPDTLKA